MSEKRIEEGETYSLIFSSLKHPIRRRILRMLAQEPLAFSEILDSLSIDSGHLSYHLASLGELIRHTPDGKYGLSSIGVAAVKLMSGVEEYPPLPVVAPVRKSHIASRKWAIILIPFVLLPCFWYFQQSAINSTIFLELTFSSFIFLGIGALLLLASKIEKASNKMKCILYAITLLSLIVTALAANSLATVPRGSIDHQYYEPAPSIFVVTLIDKHEGFTTYFLKTVINYTVEDVEAQWDTYYDNPFPEYLHIETDQSVNLSGKLRLYISLYPPMLETPSDYFSLMGSLFFDYVEVPFNLNGTGETLGLPYAPEIFWVSRGSERLEGYKIGITVLIYSLEGPDYGKELKFTVGLEAGYTEAYRGEIWISDDQVISEFQNLVALALCGLFAVIYIEILGKGIIQTMKKQEKILKLKQWLYTQIPKGAKPEPLTTEELYVKMLDAYTRIEGSTRGKWLLEKKIEEYVKQGLSREEAIRKVAQDEGYA
jgi:multisubunit Na+/H+ antiporter MnhC subunit